MAKKTEKHIVQFRIAERSLRKSVQLPAHLSVDGKEYDGFITNISCTGVGMHIDTQFPESTIDCSEGSALTLDLISPTGELIPLTCTIKWLRIQKCEPRTLTTSMGMKVVDPPPVFKKLFKSLL